MNDAPASRTNLVFAAVGVVFMGAVLAYALSHRPGREADALAPQASTASAAAHDDDVSQVIPPENTVESLAVDDLDAPAVWLDVANPAALRSVLTENAWLKQALAAPLGQGTLGDWNAFLGSKMEHLGLSALSAGLLKDVLLDALLSAPMRVTLFSDVSEPLLTLPQPTAKIAAVFAALDSTLRRGTVVAESCPGETAPTAPPPSIVTTPGVDGGPAAMTDAGVPEFANPKRIKVSKWRVADRQVYAALARDRLLMARDPRVVLQGACAPLPQITPASVADVRVAFAKNDSGRELQVLIALLGVSELSMDFSIDGSRLIPKGISGGLEHAERLQLGAISAAVMKSIPEDMPVVMAVQLALPSALDADTLSAFWRGGATPQTTARHAVVVWDPHGDARPTQVGIVWSDPKDEAALKQMFHAKNPMHVGASCGVVQLASTPELLARLQATCAGKNPSMVFGKADVKTALSAPMSIGLVIDSGRALSQLMTDSWLQDNTPKKSAKKVATPQEIDDAKTLLLQLPRWGFFGSKANTSIVPRGFSS